MIVTRLKLANVRAIEAAELAFLPGFNLLVGVNGVGKTTVLDALGVCLSAATKKANSLRGRGVSFDFEDIRAGTDALTVECDLRIGGRGHSYVLHKPRTTSVAQAGKEGLPREQVLATPERAEFLGGEPSRYASGEQHARPLAVHFSTKRAVPTERKPGKTAAAGGVEAAFAGAFADRDLRLGEFAAWIRVQETLKRERPASEQVLAAFDEAVARFLPGYDNLRTSEDDDRQLLVDRKGDAIPVRKLSDGERGILALVLDLTRRLGQANPDLADPAAEAGAVVLIDEIDLHLHPKWQRQIIHNLTATFPQCQFIVTTHSPQVIGEVEHERIQVMGDGEVYAPTHSFGVDSSRVLEEIMDTDPRALAVQNLLARVSEAMSEGDFDLSRDLLDDLADQIGEDDPEVTRIRTLIDFVEGRE